MCIWKKKSDSFVCELCPFVCSHRQLPATLLSPLFPLFSLLTCHKLYFLFSSNTHHWGFFFYFNNKLCNLFQKKVSYIIYIHSIVPGDWMSWSGWSRCSATCGTGVRWRTRDCNETSYGDLTAPCEGTSNGTEDCNTFPCRPYGT